MNTIISNSTNTITASIPTDSLYYTTGTDSLSDTTSIKRTIRTDSLANTTTTSTSITGTGTGTFPDHLFSTTTKNLTFTIKDSEEFKEII